MRLEKETLLQDNAKLEQQCKQVRLDGIQSNIFYRLFSDLLLFPNIEFKIELYSNFFLFGVWFPYFLKFAL